MTPCKFRNSALAAIIALTALPAVAQKPAITPEETHAIGLEAYVYFYPLVTMDLYLQAESPEPGIEANWLPAPNGNFIPMLRLYWPTDAPPSILDGTWTPPLVKRVP